jgi:hypothetical protein
MTERGRPPPAGQVRANLGQIAPPRQQRAAIVILCAPATLNLLVVKAAPLHHHLGAQPVKPIQLLRHLGIPMPEGIPDALD